MKHPQDLKDFSIHGTPEIPLRIYNQYYRNGGLTVPYHWHREIELIYVEQGYMEMTINTVTQRVYEKEFICINSQELHQIDSIGTQGSIHHALVFAPDILGFDYWDEVQSQYIHPLLSGRLLLPQTIATDEPYGIEILNLFKEILLLYQKKDSGWYMEIKGCLFKILGILAREDCFITVTEDSLGQTYKMEQAKKALSYIHNNYTKKIYLNELAQVMGMNPQYFCRFFKNIFQKTPVEYINQYRITQAMKLLEEDLSVLEVCLNCGFENPSYFIKLFKKQNHMTPQEYKKTRNASYD